MAVLDSGVRDRADIKSRIVYSQDFTGGGKPLDDKYGHATHVAGIITPDVVKARLMKTARKISPATSAGDPLSGAQYSVRYYMLTGGAGMVNLNAAAGATEKTTGVSASPAMFYDSATGSTRMNINSVGPNNIIWGTNIIWGAGAPAGLNRRSRCWR